MHTEIGLFSGVGFRGIIDKIKHTDRGAPCLIHTCEGLLMSVLAVCPKESRKKPITGDILRPVTLISIETCTPLSHQMQTASPVEFYSL